VSGPREQVGRVSTLELFFDLVFVFTITQLAAVLNDDPTTRGLFQVVLMLGVIFWMYGAYAWLTNEVAPDRVARRLLLLGGMAGFLVIALAIPQAFSGSGVAFGLAYLVVVSVHAGLFTRASREHTVRAVFRLAPFNLASALLVLAAVLVGGTAQYVLWTAAFALAGGVALFLVGDVLFRHSLGIGRGYSRGAAALLALATIPLGVAVSALAQLAVVVVLLGGALVAEHAMTRTGPPGTALPRDHP